MMLSANLCKRVDLAVIDQILLPKMFPGFVVSWVQTSTAQTEAICGTQPIANSKIARRLILETSDSDTTHEMDGVSVRIQVTPDADASTIERLEYHLCETFSQQGFSFSNCQESVVVKADVFSIVDPVAACPKGYALFESGAFVVLGQCMNDLTAHFALECNALGDELLLHTFDGAGCSGDSQLKSYTESVVKDVGCAAASGHIRNKDASKCQWAQFAFWESSADACDIVVDGSGALALTLPINKCISANNENAAILLGMQIDQIRADGLYWSLTTNDCKEFEASVFDNDECDGDTTFAPRVVITSNAAISGVCFRTEQCNVDNVEFARALNKEKQSNNFEEQIAVMLAIAAIAICTTLCCLLAWWHHHSDRRRMTVAQHDTELTEGSNSESSDEEESSSDSKYGHLQRDTYKIQEHILLSERLKNNQS